MLIPFPCHQLFSLARTAAWAQCTPREQIAEASAEAQATIRERTERFAAEAAERQRQLALALAEQTKAAEQEIVAAKERAFAEIRNVAVDVARSVTEKLTGSAADEAKLIPAVDRAMAESAR